MAAPMRAVKYLWNIRTNTERLLLINRDFVCSGCVNINDTVYTSTRDECHSQTRKYFTHPCRLDGNVLQRVAVYKGQLKSIERQFLTIPNVISKYCYRSYSVENNKNKNVPDAEESEQTGNSHSKENIYTVPNLLTLSRIVLTPVIGFLIVQNNFVIALGLFAYAGITDLLDGYIARNFKNQMSSLGTALDPLADKLMITVLTVTLTLAQLIPMPLAVLIIGRDVLLILTGFVIRYVSLPPPRTVKRYFDVTYPTAELLPTKLSKWNTANQIFLVFLTLAAPVFDFVDHPVLQGLWYLTAATTFGSGIDYIINWKKCIRFIK